LRAHRGELGRLPVVDRLADERDDGRDRFRRRLLDRDREVDVELDGGLDRLLLLLLLLLRQLRAQPAAESGFGLVAQWNAFVNESTAGPRMTTNIEGKMKSAVGKSILIGAFIAFSSAAA